MQTLLATSFAIPGDLLAFFLLCSLYAVCGLATWLVGPFGKTR